MNNPRVIAITGASSGIGTALALYYAGSGVTLHLHGRNEQRLGEVAETCRKRGAVVHCTMTDVRDMAGMDAWLSAADEREPIDLLIANAGISGGSGGHAVMGEDADQLRRIMAVNVDGVLNTVTPLLGRMVARKRGQIALMSSMAGFRGLPSAPAYSTSKMAVRGYGEALRGWVGKHGVEVSVICPGYIRTPLTSLNGFPMPLLMEADKAARIIARGLARNRSRIAFPLPIYWLMLIMAALPPFITDPLFARLPAKPSLPES